MYKKSISSGPKLLCFWSFFKSTAVTFIRHGNKMILTRKVLSDMQAHSIWQTWRLPMFPVINPQVFQVYRRNHHTTKPAIWKKKTRHKSGFFLHWYLNHSQSIKLEPHNFDFCSVLTSRGLSFMASCSLNIASSPKGCHSLSFPSITTHSEGFIFIFLVFLLADFCFFSIGNSKTLTLLLELYCIAHCWMSLYENIHLLKKKKQKTKSSLLFYGEQGRGF